MVGSEPVTLKHRQDLLSALLEAVKACQVRFGTQARMELATEEHDEQGIVRKLCLALERTFLHGWKVVESAGSSGSMLPAALAGGPHGQAHPASSASFWPLLKAVLSRSELERFYLLKHVNSDLGRCRAWLRASLNEHSFERGVQNILADGSKLKTWYGPGAFILDPERAAMLPQMAAGLSSILFAMNIDHDRLNAALPLAGSGSTSHSELLATTAAKDDHSGPQSKARRKKKKAAAQIVSFDEDVIRTQSLHTSDSRKPGTSVKPRKTWDESPSRLSYDSIRLVGTPEVNGSADDGSTEDEIQVYRSSKDAIGKLTPMKNSEVGGLIPVNPGHSDLPGEEIQSEDSMSIKSFMSEDGDYANASILKKTAKCPKGAPSTVASSIKSSQHNQSAISREDLKNALLSVMERKEELQVQCQTLKKLLANESGTVLSFKEELAESKRISQESSDKFKVRVQTLSRENDLLKHQLKKYVGAVQKLRDGPEAYETLAQLQTHGSGETESGGAQSKYIDYHFEASEYEKKLIQVAEMHGELIEFNEHLQKGLQARDALIHRMREELVDLRGPLPLDESNHPSQHGNDDVASVISETASIGSTSRGGLLHIWIPSVFLSGSGSKTHHVYQVYLRIKNDEWNIYRRYSEFHTLHRDLKAKEPLVETFDFPPKKTVGNKADKVVEDRRKRLQTYLRKIVNLMVQTNPSLATKADKENVLLLMPFFKESVAPSSSHPRQNRSQSQPRSLFNRGRSTTTTTTPQLAI
ncbi:hypothetical protein TCAL_08575 [Tigriopus californicus]|uniref:PX domain-containing protein n=1 Tax=Tigriopus californicus TaxID=6832 RepID=A0A553PBM1_TIGCA|nr:sorting nexin-29-like [Tigriopus californicus]TRY75070.1 hypothetical protein TCAL_08575 [Tigriopus californicus]|eukprot:TCALIF_08575-PA protein Name:"Similar to SNX29 Sorting nexin-29 (Bos taurus)" AED:0.01 eAED:0.01 QI:0/-1/0/1/-1/1/1/0/754